jgi:hypothetical protein
MALEAKRRAESGLRRYTRKRIATLNKRWLHLSLSAGKVGVMDSLQPSMGLTSLVCTNLFFVFAA